MSRRDHNASPLETLFLLARRLPWWLSLGIAVLGYFFFSTKASAPIGIVSGTTGAEISKSMTAIAATAVWKPFAMILQYLLPLLFGAGAVLSFVASRARRQSPLEPIVEEQDSGTRDSPHSHARGREATYEAGYGAPQCPRCASLMVSRTATRGANAGNTFWGCSRYPRCNGTRP